MQNQNKRKRTKQVQRAVSDQVYEENALALAFLSQCEQKDESLVDEDTSQRCLDHTECEESENYSLECYDTKSPNPYVSQSPATEVSEKQAQVSETTSNLNDGEDNGNEDSEILCYLEDGGSSNSESSDTEVEFEDQSDPGNPQEQDNTGIFFVNQKEFSPEVWRIIKGEEEEKTQEEILKIKLPLWSMKYKIKRNALDELLHILRDHGHSELPACAKTLLKTPRSTTDMVKTLAGGQFWYRGLEKALLSCLSAEYVISLQDDTVVIDIFVDGLSPHKKARRSIWPIAGCLKGVKTPFVIALWCGSSKEPTSVDEFFEEFVNESAHLLENGFLYNGRKLKLCIRRYCADAPARAWIKQVKPHNSYDSCERCTVPGEWKFRRMTYNPSKVGQLRTDESFKNQTHSAHHLGVSPLLQLGTGMITQVPLDVMHMCYLGLSRRLYSLLLSRKKGRFKLPDSDVQHLDKLCNFLYKYCPSDFASKPRPLSQYLLYKATEWRRVFLYDGFILHKNHKHKEVYECYLLAACAMRILLDSKLRSEFSDDAHELFVSFVKRSYSLLGASFVVYNIHHVLHLVADCKIHGDPEDFSCFKFENDLGHLKDLLEAPGRSLQQLICRLIERSLAPASAAAPAPTQQQYKKPHNFGPTLDCNGEQYSETHFAGSKIHVARDNPRDAFVLLSSGKVVVIHNIVVNKSGTYIIGREFVNTGNYFCFPMPSSLLDIYKVSNLGPFQKWNINKISKKLYFLPLVDHGDFDGFNWSEDEGLCIPILHSEV